MDTAERRAVAALWCLPGIGPRSVERIRAALGDLGQQLERPVERWAPSVELPPAQAGALRRVPEALAAVADRLERRLRQVGQRAIYPGQPAWPAGLHGVREAPPVLFVQGPGAAVAPRRRAAVVGTRHPDPGVCEQVTALAAHLAEAGMGVVSGAAEGVDQAAHAGALRAGGETWAFLGEGIDRLTGPRASLATELRRRGGTLFSQHPPGTPGSAAAFRRRNPLISGASDVVLVARAPLKSGALITAAAARAQGRPLLAVPGDPWNPRAEGCNRLLLDRHAAPCLSADEVLAAVGLPLRRHSGRTPTPGPTSSAAGEVLASIRQGGVDVDLLAARTGLEVGRLMGLLVELQLAGHLVQKGGGRYELSGPS